MPDVLLRLNTRVLRIWRCCSVSIGRHSRKVRTEVSARAWLDEAADPSGAESMIICRIRIPASMIFSNPIQDAQGGLKPSAALRRNGNFRILRISQIE